MTRKPVVATVKPFIPTGTVTMQVHEGKALGIAVSNYARLFDVAKELVQNSLDSEATEIFIYVDYEKRKMCVRDNGCGMSIEGFGKAISSICSSIKSQSKLGQFGIGFMSPIGKCKFFAVTSSPKGEQAAYHRWSFDCHQILNSSSLPQIPYEAMPNLVFSRSPLNSAIKKGVNWRTEVALLDFIKDSRINGIVIGDLRNAILSQFSEVMKRLDTTITIRVKRENVEPEDMKFKAAQFKGDKMPMVEYGDDKVGKTTFEIWISPKGARGRKGEVIVGLKGNDFRISMALFAKSIRDDVASETLSCLLSGTFEGQILSNKCTLSENRTQFVDDDSRMEFCIHLDSWVKNHGQKVVAEIKDEKRDQWLQAIGSMALASLETMLKSMPHLMAVVKRFDIGSIGPGHKNYPSLSSEQDQTTKTAHAPTTHERLNGKEKKPGLPKGEPIKDYPGHSPMTVAGPKGTRRKMVRGSSTGITFIFEEMPGVDDHWVFDSETGTLIFNTRSDCWEKAERSGEKTLVLYQQYIAIKVLELQLVPDSVYGVVFNFLQRELKTAVDFIINTSAQRGRKSNEIMGKKV